MYAGILTRIILSLLESVPMVYVPPGHLRRAIATTSCFPYRRKKTTLLQVFLMKKALVYKTSHQCSIPRGLYVAPTSRRYTAESHLESPGSESAGGTVHSRTRNWPYASEGRRNLNEPSELVKKNVSPEAERRT